MGTNTTNYNFYKPADDETGWGSNVNDSFDDLDSLLNSHFVVTQSSGSLNNEHLHTSLYNWYTYHFEVSGTLSSGSQVVPSQICPGDMTIHGAYPYAQGASSGSAIIFDVNKNDVTIFTTQGNRPTISSGSNAGSLATPDVTALALNDRLDLDVDQIGTPTSGSRATVEVWCKQYLKI